jgi:putative PIN family toxin of toxin-antitoxin system
MIKIVPDTNVLVSGMMGYKSPSRKILNLSLSKRLQLIGCNKTLIEFCEKVKLPRMKQYWEKKYFSSDKIIQDYQTLVMMHEPTEKYEETEIPIRDPDDAIFFQLAMSCGAKIIISNDEDALALNGYEGIKVITPEVFINAYQKVNPTQSIVSAS